MTQAPLGAGHSAKEKTPFLSLASSCPTDANGHKELNASGFVQWKYLIFQSSVFETDRHSNLGLVDVLLRQFSSVIVKLVAQFCSLMPVCFRMGKSFIYVIPGNRSDLKGRADFLHADRTLHVIESY